MKKLLAVAVLGISILTFSGCNDKRCSAPMKMVERQIQSCRTLVSDGSIDCSREEFLGLRRSLSHSITNVSDKAARAELANQYISMMSDVDLSLHDEEYRDFEMRVLRFEALIGTIFNVLKMADLDMRVQMEYFLGSLEKYKKACFSIPTTARSANESAQEFSRRKAAVNNLHAMYLSRMCTFERGERPGLLMSLPAELLDEYKRRSAAILSCPSREDLSKTPMFKEP